MSHGSRWKGFLCLLWLTACVQSGEEPTELAHLTVGLEADDGGIPNDASSEKVSGDGRVDCPQPTPGQPTCPECRAYPIGEGRYTISLPSNTRYPVYLLAPERPQGVHVWPQSSFPTRTVSDRVVIDVTLTTGKASTGNSSGCGAPSDFILWLEVSDSPEPPLVGIRPDEPRCRKGTSGIRCQEP